jgi:hypothetical protein
MPLIDSSGVVINAVKLTDQSGDPAAPAAGHLLYTKSGGVYSIDSSSAISGPFAAATAGGTLNDYICIQDQKTQDTHGGTFTTGAWRTRDLNTEVSDTGGHASVASNQITLAAGTYTCRILVPGVKVNAHKAKLYNITDGADVLLGLSGFSDTNSIQNYFATIVGKFVIAAPKVLEVQHNCSNTNANYGFGNASGFGVEVYTTAEFWKIA